MVHNFNTHFRFQISDNNTNYYLEFKKDKEHF